MSGIEFTNIPSNIVAPIITFEVNSAGEFQNESRVLIIGHATSAGEIAANTPTFPRSRRDARRLLGAGSIGYDMYRAADLAGATNLWVMSAAATGTAEVRTATIGTVPAAGGVGVIEIEGRALQVTIAPGDTASDVAAALAEDINSYHDPLTGADLSFTASATNGVVTLTARHAGEIFNGVDIHVPDRVGNSANALAGEVTLAVTTAGAGVPDLSTALAALGDDPWDWIISPFSDSGNMGRYATLLSDVSGRWSYDQQTYGHVFTVKRDTTANITTYGVDLDDRHLSTLPVPTTGGFAAPVWRFLAGMIGRITNQLSDGSNGGCSKNQTGLEIPDIPAPRDRTTWPQFDLRNTYLQLGISTWKVRADGQMIVDKVITHHQTEDGAPDIVFRDIQSIAQVVLALRTFRADLAFQHSNKIAARDNPTALQAISTPKDVEATLIAIHAKLVTGGVLQDTRSFAQAVRVEVNGASPNRYDIFAPLERTHPLDVLAANATIYSRRVTAAA